MWPNNLGRHRAVTLVLYLKDKWLYKIFRGVLPLVARLGPQQQLLAKLFVTEFLKSLSWRWQKFKLVVCVVVVVAVGLLLLFVVFVEMHYTLEIALA